MRRSITAGAPGWPASGEAGLSPLDLTSAGAPVRERSSAEAVSVRGQAETGSRDAMADGVPAVLAGPEMLRRAGRTVLALVGRLHEPLAAPRIGRSRAGQFWKGRGGPRPVRDTGLEAAFLRTQWAAGLDVLIVDDNASNRFLVERYFRDSGARLRAAQNGAEAVAAYAECRADLVLLDLSMPVMDGNQAARRIRAIERERGWPTATLVALTANSAPAARAAAYDAGMNDFLEKPLRRQVLVDYVRARFAAAG